jgi:hypothetical protein
MAPLLVRAMVKTCAGINLITFPVRDGKLNEK